MSKTSQNTGEQAQPLPRVLLCGDPRTAEFQEASRELRTIVPETSCSAIHDLQALQVWLGQNDCPDFIVLVQTWSDEFSFTEMLTLPGIGPFSRLICCYGPWCISDGRSRQDFPLAIRVPLEHLRPALLAEWQRLIAPRLDDELLPWTAGRDEIFRHRHPARKSPLPPETRLTIGVRSPDRELARLWSDVLRTAGYSATTTDLQPECQVVVWDVDMWTDEIGDQWRTELQRFPELQIVALTGLVEPHLAAEMRAAGAAAVVSKLLPLEALLAQIARLPQRNRS